MTNKIKNLESLLVAEKAKQLFVAFYSPGTFFCESSRKEVKSKDLKDAVILATKISERHGARPFGFRFEDGNGKTLSGMYYITGRVFKRDDVPDTPENNILRSNMRSRPVCIENNNSWKYTGEFNKEDFVVDWNGNITDSGDKYENYRKKVQSEKY